MPRYPEFTDEQVELINFSRGFLSKALNSPYYQLFKKSINSHILVEQSDLYANEFSKSLISQRPLGFPEEIRKRIKIGKDEYQLGLHITSENSSDNEGTENEKEKAPEEENQDEFEVKGLWEDGIESESLDSEEII